MQARIDAIDPAVSLPAYEKDSLLAYNGNKRWEYETAGIIINGHPIKTDADSQRKTTTLDRDMQSGVTTSVDFKLADGTFLIGATMTDIDAFYAGIMAHIDSCYTTESSVVTQINSGAITTSAQVDSAYSSIPVLNPPAAGTMDASMIFTSLNFNR
jgi:hypothetical protein